MPFFALKFHHQLSIIISSIPFFNRDILFHPSSNKSRGGERDNLSQTSFSLLFFFLVEFSPSTAIYPLESKETRLDE